MSPADQGGDRVGSTIVKVFRRSRDVALARNSVIGRRTAQTVIVGGCLPLWRTAEFTTLVIPTVDAPRSLRECSSQPGSNEPNQATRNSIVSNNARMDSPQSNPNIVLCPSCGRPMRLARTTPKLPDRSELRSYECRSCSVYFTTAQPCDSRDTGVLVRPV
jgi:hypothetical protein